MTRRRRDAIDDLEALRLFLLRARRVEASPIVQQAIGSKLEISWRQGAGLRFTSTEPPATLLQSLLLDLRPIVVLQAPTNVGFIVGVGERRLRSDAHRRALREGRAEWRRAQRKSSTIALRVNELDLSPEYVMDLWLNGYYFHDEIAKEQALARLAPHGQILSRAVFLDYVYAAVDCVIWTASVFDDAIANDLLER